MIDVSELMTDPDFVQPLEVHRLTGSFVVEGEYSESDELVLTVPASVQHPKPSETARFLAEGNRNNSIIRIFCGQPLQVTDGRVEHSDRVIWQGGTYRVFECNPWGDNGYWVVFAERIT